MSSFFSRKPSAPIAPPPPPPGAPLAIDRSDTSLTIAWSPFAHDTHTPHWTDFENTSKELEFEVKCTCVALFPRYIVFEFVLIVWLCLISDTFQIEFFSAVV
jgi:hypothetical protein